jgi:hypothetical protein
MNALALFLALVLQGNPTCHSEEPVRQSVNGHSYAVQTFDCYWKGYEFPPSHSFEVWSPDCGKYVGDPIVVKERQLHKGWVMNEFGEFYPATIDVDLMHVYRPACGP